MKWPCKLYRRHRPSGRRCGRSSLLTGTLLIVSVLCLVQFAWTITKERVLGWDLVLAIGGVLAMNVVFHVTFRYGESFRRSRAQADAAQEAAAASPLS